MCVREESSSSQTPLPDSFCQGMERPPSEEACDVPTTEGTRGIADISSNDASSDAGADAQAEIESQYLRPSVGGGSGEGEAPDLWVPSSGVGIDGGCLRCHSTLRVRQGCLRRLSMDEDGGGGENGVDEEGNRRLNCAQTGTNSIILAVSF